MDKNTLVSALLATNLSVGDGMINRTEPYTKDMAEVDAEILLAAHALYEGREGPRLGDFVRWADGTYSRFSHDWDDALQTSRDGSFYLGKGGWIEFSGGLDPSIPKTKLAATKEMRNGSVWTFSQGFAGAGRGVRCLLPFHVYEFQE